MTDVFFDSEPTPEESEKQPTIQNKKKMSKKRKIAIALIILIVIYLFSGLTLNIMNNQKDSIIYIPTTITKSTVTCTVVAYSIIKNNSTVTYYEPLIIHNTTTNYYQNTNTNRYNQSGIIIQINNTIAQC